MTGIIHLEVVVLEFPLVLEGTELVFKVPSVVLGETCVKKCKVELPVCGADIVGLAKLVNVCLSWGPLNDNLELGVTHLGHTWGIVVLKSPQIPLH